MVMWTTDSEFMIAVNETQSRADLVADFVLSTGRRDTLCVVKWSLSFYSAQQKKILTTGKYLNVLRGCGVAN